MQTTTSDALWTALAACAGENPALFMSPDGREAAENRRTRETVARQICSQCPVRVDCLAYSLRVSEPLGIWGGLTETERRALRS